MNSPDKKTLSERDICTKFITPAIEQAGWDVLSQIREEVYFTKGRIIVRDKLVNSKEAAPRPKRGKVDRSMKTLNKTFIRASISFPADVYDGLKNLAKQKKVSLAWVVRDAAERYVADTNPESRQAPPKASAPRGN